MMDLDSIRSNVKHYLRIESEVSVVTLVNDLCDEIERLRAQNERPQPSPSHKGEAQGG